MFRLLRLIWRILTIGFRYRSYRGVYSRRSNFGKVFFTLIFTIMAAASVVGELIVLETIFGTAFEGKKLLVLIIGIPVTAYIGIHSFGFLSKVSLAAFASARKIKRENRKIDRKEPEPITEGAEESVSGNMTSVADTTRKSPVLDNVIGLYTMVMSLLLVATLIALPMLYLKAAGK